MPDDPNWITTAIMKARQGSPTVPEDVCTKFESLLKGKLSERAIPAVELANVAMMLMGGMVATPAKAKERQ
jgi:hypothetical protein